MHVVAGLTCVVSGIVAMLSPKQAGRHPRVGALYCWALVVVFATMAFLSAVRWREDYHLFVLGALSLATAIAGRRLAPSRAPKRVRLHVTLMGLSYIFLLTAFYVDNGPNLPLWRLLPALTYWLLPLLVGLPLIIRVLLRHPVVVRTSVD